MIGCGSVSQVDDSGDGDGDGDVDAGPNSAPVINALTFDSSNPAEAINVSCDATDADGDTLTFSYQVTAGTITGDSSTATWEPGVEGEALVMCAVDDGNGGADSLDVMANLRVDGGLVAQYLFNGDASDQTGTAAGTIIASGGFVADRFGNAGGALAFTGNTSVTLANEAAFDLADQFTLSVWVSVAASANRRPIITKSPAASGGFGNFYLEVFGDPNGRMGYAHDIVGGNTSGGGSLSKLPNDQFIHYALTFGAGTLTGYLNGDVQTTGASAAPIVNNSPAQIGTGNFGIFLGVIDEVRVYNRALSAAEVAAIAGDTGSL